MGAGLSPTSSAYSTNSSGYGSAEVTIMTPNYQGQEQQQHNRLKRKKIESVVELDNDDACSEDAFIRKIASATSSGAEILPFTPNEQTAAAAAIITPTAIMPAAPTK